MIPLLNRMQTSGLFFLLISLWSFLDPARYGVEDPGIVFGSGLGSGSGQFYISFTQEHGESVT